MNAALSLTCITLATCVLATVVVLLSWRYRPAMWAADLGLPPQDVVAGGIVALVILAVVTGGAVAAGLLVTERWGILGAGVTGWAVMVAFGLWDFVVIDCFFFIHLRPSWFYVAGMEGTTAPIYDWRHHAKESLPTLLFGIPVGAVAAGVAALVT
ncbi:MAG: hypothetical protein AAGA56_09850 [Myxococcota bacterium]